MNVTAARARCPGPDPPRCGKPRSVTSGRKLLATRQRHHYGVREHESPGAHLIESGIYMSDGSSATEDTKSAPPSPLRLRVGVFLILLWIVPFWALAPYIAHSLSGLSNPPSVAAVTTTILVVQTIIGLLGFWVAGAAVKSIIKGSTMRHALAAIWSMLIHGDIQGQGEVGNDPNEGQPSRDED
jgi:hypothetical protein